MSDQAVAADSRAPARIRIGSPLWAIGFLLVLVAVAFRDTFGAMVTVWMRSDTFAHAFLVLPISAWLVWRRRHLLAALPARPAPLWLLPLAVVAAAWLVGDLAGVNALTQAAATALIVLAVPAVLGTRVARDIAFPLAFLFFMVPFGEFLMPTLMELTADFTVAALTATGIPVYREGLQFVIPSGAWSVVEACSGVRYLIASFMVGTLFAYLNYRSLRYRVVFCLLALAVPVLANWMRAYMIVMIGHLSGNTLAVGVDHLIYGWLFFGVVIGLMFFIGARWSEPEQDLAAPTRVAGAAVGPAPEPGKAIWGAALAAALIAVAPQAMKSRFDEAVADTPALALPHLPGVPESDLASGYRPLFEGTAARVARVYGEGGAAVAVDVAYYRNQRYGQKLVSSANMLVRSDDKEWHRTRSALATVQVGGRAVELRSAELRTVNSPGNHRQTRIEVRQLLWVNGRLTSNDHVAAGLAVLNRLAGQGDDAAAITFYQVGEADISASLDAFVARHLPAFEASLAAARERR